ncbi:Sec-independent protein translocase protein TatA [Desulfovibrionales bacterium]
MIGGISFWEVMIVLVIILVLFGSNKLPEIGSSMGKAIKNFKRSTSEPDEIDIAPNDKQKAKGKDAESND